MRGKISKAVVILGSATPSLESYLNVKKGKYCLQTLTKRTEKAVLPKMTIVDMKREFEKARGPTTFSEPLIEGLKERVQKGEQSILFLNVVVIIHTYFAKSVDSFRNAPIANSL